MKLVTKYMLTLFALHSPFDACGNAWKQSEQQDPANQPLPPPQYCTTDPPLECVGVCLTGPMAAVAGSPPPTPTPACSAGSDLARLFVTDVQTILVCDENLYPNMESYVVFPPFFQIAPQVIEAGDGCVQPPVLPDTMPFGAFMMGGP
jgi:hypothetical protein